MRILLTGYYGFGNLGDDILLKVTYNTFRNIYPEAEFYVYSNFNPNLSSYDQVSGYNKYIYNLVGKEAKLIDWTYKGHFDLVVNGGGGIYFDHNNKNVLYRLLNVLIGRVLGINGAGFIEQVLRKLMNKPAHISFGRRIGVGIGIGKFAPGAPSLFRKLAELNTYNFLWVRDDHSIQQLKKFRFNKKAYKFTDIAFVKQGWKEWADRSNHESRKKTIGIILMDLKENENQFFRTIKSFEQKAAGIGYEVKYFSFDENYDKSFVSAFTDSHLLVWKPNLMLFSDFLQQIETCGIVISARAHGAILGGVLGAVPVCLESSIKLREVAKMFAKSGRIIPLNISDHKLMEVLVDIENNWDKLQSFLKEEVKYNEKMAAAGILKVQNYVIG